MRGFTQLNKQIFFFEDLPETSEKGLTSVRAVFRRGSMRGFYLLTYLGFAGKVWEGTNYRVVSRWLSWLKINKF